MLSSMKKRSPNENTRDELKAFLLKEEMVDSLIDQIFRVLDMDRTGYFSKDDLLMFLGFFYE
jgi:hypothetical protein